MASPRLTHAYGVDSTTVVTASVANRDTILFPDLGAKRWRSRRWIVVDADGQLYLAFVVEQARSLRIVRLWPDRRSAARCASAA